MRNQYSFPILWWGASKTPMSTILYCIPFILAVGTFASLLVGGLWTFFVLVIAFGLVPMIDQLGPGSTDDLSPAEAAVRLANPWFDRLLYATIPVHFAILGVGIHHIVVGAYPGASLVGAVASVGISCGIFGINIGHELGHRGDKRHHRAAQLLLFSTLYLHFFIEHNRGHHRRVATPDDPASARRGETIYAFWFRSVFGGARGAWYLEAARLRHIGSSVWSFHNQMLVSLTIQGAAIVGVGLVAGPAAVGWWMVASLIGILLLETVNYMEHYGLTREKNENGVFERVRPEHSWNSDRVAGRVVLYDLTRHSDHHAHVTRPYSMLRHSHDAPQLPMGYPAMILLSLVPPLFFSVMDPAVDNWRSNRRSPSA